MKKLNGEQVPNFTYDTPTETQKDFYYLCNDEKPLLVVFLPNFGHPISQSYISAYLETFNQLTLGRLACVVKSMPNIIAKRLGDVPLPFTLICDADAVLYDYLEVKSTTSIFDWTFAARKIINEAKKQGYELTKGQAQLLPLTVVFGKEGEILYAHRARSLTDLPEDCDAIEQVCRRVLEKQSLGK